MQHRTLNIIKRSYWLAISGLLIAITLNTAHAFSCADTTTTGVPQLECEALLTFYDSTNGDNWSSNTHWRTATAVANWQGVFVDNGHVTTLYLPHNGLTGTIPPAIADLTHLQYLTLFDNQITGTLPSELSNLTHLTHLILQRNAISSIPPELGQLTSLTYIDLSTNAISNIPPELGSLTYLEYFSLFNNQLTGNIPPELGYLTNLYTLVLSHNQLTGPIPVELANATNLLYVILDNNYLTGDSPDASLATLFSGLNGLSIANNCLNPTDATIRSILDNQDPLWSSTQFNCSVPTTTDCSAVTEIPSSECEALLNLYDSTGGDNWLNNGDWQQTNTPCSWYGVTCVNGHVEQINLTANQLTGHLPDLALPNLTLLLLASNQLTGAIPSFANAPALVELNLAANQFTYNIPTFATANLNALFLQYNQLGGMIPTFSQLNSLATLDISNNALCVDAAANYAPWTTQVAAYPDCEDTLEVIKGDTGQGLVISADGLIACDIDCQRQTVAYDGIQLTDATATPTTLPTLHMVTLTATPATGSSFVNWEMACTGSDLTTQVVVGAATRCRANFALNSGYVMNLTKVGNGTGRVYTVPDNSVNCNKHCVQVSATYAAGEQVNLKATAEAGSTFVGWVGDCSGTNPEITLTMDADKNCAANYAVITPPPVGMYTLTLQVNAHAATDTVVSTYPVGINCPDDCVENYNAGARVNLKAFPDSTSQFIGWSGDCQGRQSSPVLAFTIMDANKTCIANFTSQPVLRQ